MKKVHVFCLQDLCVLSFIAYLKKSVLQYSLPSLEKHFSVKLHLQSQHCTHLACHARSSTFRRNLSRMGRSHPAHWSMFTTESPKPRHTESWFQYKVLEAEGPVFFFFQSKWMRSPWEELIIKSDLTSQKGFPAKLTAKSSRKKVVRWNEIVYQSVACRITL